jgi:hypothetical protein
VHLDRCDLIEVLGVWDAKATHSMLMTPFLEMPLKRSTTPVTIVPTYLTFKFLTCRKIIEIL